MRRLCGPSQMMATRLIIGVFSLSCSGWRRHAGEPAAGAQQQGQALSTRKGREASRRRSPWQRRSKRPYRGAKLVPFGSRCVFLNDGTSRILGKPLKYEPRGRVGLVLGYGPLRSYLVMDLRHFIDTHGEVKLVTTRDYRVVHGEYPLRNLKQGGHSLEVDEVVLRLMDPHATRRSTSALDDGYGSCVLCGRSVEMVIVDCPACRHRKRAHTMDARCRRTRGAS